LIRAYKIRGLTEVEEDEEARQLEQGFTTTRSQLQEEEYSTTGLEEVDATIRA
jgi:hypothetical protein